MRRVRYSKETCAIPMLYRWPKPERLRERMKRGTFPNVGEDWLLAYSAAREELSRSGLKRKLRWSKN